MGRPTGELRRDPRLAGRSKNDANVPCGHEDEAKDGYPLPSPQFLELWFFVLEKRRFVCRHPTCEVQSIGP